MSYKVSDGIDKKSLTAWLHHAAKRYGTFSDGQVDYTKADIAPIIMCTLYAGGKILIVERGYGLADAEGYWSTVNGFIDEDKPLEEFVRQELSEELGLKHIVAKIRVADSYTMDNTQEKRRYITFPCLVELEKQPDITLNQENTAYRWIKRQDLEKFHILDDLPLAIDSALELL